jgi:sugar phosphate isomerase/epimerase
MVGIPYPTWGGLSLGGQKSARAIAALKQPEDLKGQAMKLGINSYTFMWSIGFKGANPAYPEAEALPARPLTALGLLQKARDLGVTLVQTGPNLPLPEAELPVFIAAARQGGITLELGTRGLDDDHLRRQISIARSMGAKLIRTLPEIGGEYAADARLIPPAVRRITPVLEQAGVCLAIENGRTPAADLRAALDEIASPYVGIVLDMVNSMSVPEGWKYVTEQLAPHVMCVHYKDFTIRRAWHMMGFLVEGVPAGQGMVETGWLFDTLKASRHPFNVIIELWPPEQSDLETAIALENQWAVESVQYLRKFVHEM